MTVAEILAEAGEDERQALREHATLLALSRISRYEAECGRFREKYGESLSSFRECLQSEEGREDFEKEDDLLDWEYAETALSWWRNRLTVLHNAD